MLNFMIKHISILDPAKNKKINNQKMISFCKYIIFHCKIENRKDHFIFFSNMCIKINISLENGTEKTIKSFNMINT